ncbi:AAA family ATPase [Bacillus sp. FJAT-49711]|uniref:ATP-binding protein n=1 Tax=Bacillus sp. FJAT-49711 TaxID=2833585 RepID=UPI001BCA18ED|nr:AAA family ATPase [Bacillus sp. FJAT-49711]MBS4218133.1 AAA family ATPase [Bacillus sp. FJAT-49711]
MKLKSLHIFGYGKLIDFYIHDISDMQIIYGENEAGKSTIMSFIHSILFGFPSRQQSSLRYEPKNHSAYGGRITVETKEHGEVIIERVKGKSAGNVTVFLENGLSGSEELLSQLLGGVDRSLFESIFSFNLQGIQEVQKLKGDEISRYLVASGTMGTDILLNVEQSFQKELDQLFKPNGRKPILNEKIAMLRESERDLQKAKQKNAEYGSIIIKIEATDKQAAHIKNALSELNEKLQVVNELIEKWDQIKEFDRIHQNIKELGAIQFPTDGLTRFERLSEKVIMITSRLLAVNKKMTEIDKRIEDHTPLKSFQSMLDKTEKVLMEWPIYEQIQSEITNLKRELSNYKDQISRICRELNYSDEQYLTIPSLNLGLDVKGKIKDSLNHKVMLSTRLDGIQTQLNATKTEIESLEAACEKIELNLLSEHDFKQLELEREEWKDTNQLLQEKDEIERSLQKDENNAQKTKKSLLFNSIFLFCSLGFVVWGVFSSEWMISAFAGFIFIYAISNFITVINRLYSINHEKEQVQARIQLITEKIRARKNDKNPIQLYDEQLHYRNELKNHDHQLDQKLKNIEHLQMQKQKIVDQIEINQSKIDHFKKELRISLHFTDSRLEDAFDLLLELMNRMKGSEKVELELSEKVFKQKQWLENLNELAQSAGFEFTETSETIFRLKQLFKIEQEKKHIQKDLLEKRAEILEERDQLQLELQEFQTLIDQLFKMTNTHNEEEFRTKARLYEESILLKERLDILDANIGNRLKEKAAAFKSSTELKQRKNELLKLIDEKSSCLHNLQNEFAALRHEIQVIEEGGTYSEKLHQFYHLKSSFNEEARIWAKYSVARDILQKTMDKYIKERFPMVINKAQDYLSFLTDKMYNRIHFKDDEGIAIDHVSGQRFNPVELSQGTSEQLYTALRLALVQVLYEDYPFPIIIDDGFVNFDKLRTKKVLQLIESISNKSQVLLFTCHDHIKSHFSDRDVKYLPLSQNTLQTIKL